MQSALEIFQKTWVFKLGGALLLVLVCNFFLRRFFKRSKKFAKFDHAVLTPIRVFVWVLFGTFVLELIFTQWDLAKEGFTPKSLRSIALVFCLAWLFFRLKEHLMQKLDAKQHANKRAFDPTTLEIFGKIYSIVILFITALILLQVIGLDIAPLLAFGGIGAAALGFASKDAISNFYGGLTIYLTRPFIMGDLIELPGKGLLGTIEKIGWYFTTLRDMSKKPVYIPNAFFSTELLINQTRMTHRRIDEKLSLRYSDASKVQPLVEDIRTVFNTHPGIDRKEPIYVFINALENSSILLELRGYTISTRYDEFMEIRQAILIRVCELVEKHGAGIGYPVREQVSRPISI